MDLKRVYVTLNERRKCMKIDTSNLESIKDKIKQTFALPLEVVEYSFNGRLEQDEDAEILEDLIEICIRQTAHPAQVSICLLALYMVDNLFQIPVVKLYSPFKILQ